MILTPATDAELTDLRAFARHFGPDTFLDPYAGSFHEAHKRLRLATAEMRERVDGRVG